MILWGGTVQAEPAALIVAGLAGSPGEAEEFDRQAGQAKEILIQRGLKPERIRLLNGRLNREQVLAALRETGAQSDEFWLVLFGHVGTAPGGQPAFQVRGPRVTADDLQAALKESPGSKVVVIATERSGEFLPFLQGNGWRVLTATAGAGEINAPRFPEHWLKEFAANPRGDLAEIAAKAAAGVAAEYQQLGLAQSEHARLLTADGSILEAPFGAGDGSSVAPSAPGTSATGTVTAASIQIPQPDWGGEFEHQPATDETRQLIAETKDVANPDGFGAILLRQERELTIHADRSTSEVQRLRVLLLKPEAFDEWAEYRFSQQAPLSEYRVESGRIVLPDATSWVLNGAKLGSAVPDAKAGVGGQLRVLFPQAQPGAVVEIAFEHKRRAEMALPEFYEEIPLQRGIPALSTQVSVRTPETAEYFFKLANAGVKPVSGESGGMRVLSWKLENLSAYQPLPLDPPRRDQLVWLGISSLPSWEKFAQWYGRIARDSNVAGPRVKEMAGRIAAANPGRPDRIRSAFEFVSSLRYVAIEDGIQGFRPRTPEVVLRQLYGDCKDKANLLGALLREMGIPAQFALINRGSSTDPDFPGWQFNHAIAYLPEEDLWLDSTDTTTPYGFIAPGNLGRSALVFSSAETAAFKPVTNSATSTLRDHWRWQWQDGQPWSGRLEQRWTGIGERELREQLAGLSPAQRREFLQRHLAALLPWAEFAKIRATEPKALADPMTLTAEASSADIPAPSAGLELAAHLAAPDRDRPLVINDGQPLRIEQVVEWTSPRPGTAPPPAFRREAAGAVFSIESRRRDAQTLERTAVADFRRPVIAPADYAAFRDAFREWLKILQTPLKDPS